VRLKEKIFVKAGNRVSMFAHTCTSVANSEIQAYNSGLNKIAKLYRHVAVIECDSNREYFTRHGLHLNNTGKDRLSKQIAF
jgi:hypothetical protein